MFPGARKLALATFAATSSLPTAWSFDWYAIEPSPDLEYHDCYETSKCARLKLPLDWLAADNGTDDGRTVAIAVMMVPAVVPTNHSAYAGPIFTNPGGPGGSGIQTQLGLGPYIQSIVDKPNERHYDIVSFDPRGVGLSTPAVNCYPDDQLARSVSRLEMRQTFDSRTALKQSLPYTLAQARAFGQRCEGQEVLPYVNTPSVARDMVAMIDKSPRGNNMGGKDDVARLNYLGFSYGTVLGNVFASLFPGRVGRMVLDGVVDAYDYMSGPGWVRGLVDTDKMYDVFFEGCYNSAENCTLYRETDESPKDIQGRVDDFIRSLDEAPQVAFTPDRNSTGLDVVVTGTDIRSMFGFAFYTAIFTYTRVAEVLDIAISTGDLTALVPFARSSTLQDNCTPADIMFNTNGDQGLAIRCSDGEDVSNKTVEWWEDYIDGLIDQSDVFGQAWASGRVMCAGWPARPNWDFNGPFESPEADADLSIGKPAAPILFVSARLDPVTPLQAARDMSEGHPGSKVLVVEAEGHCGFLAGPSKCRDAFVREYLDTGVLPEEQETICESECGPWDVGCSLNLPVDDMVMMRGGLIS